MPNWSALLRADYGPARLHCQPLNVLVFGCSDPQVIGVEADGDPAALARNGDYRSMAPFPAMIFDRNFSMRAMRVSGFLVELRWMT